MRLKGISVPALEEHGGDTDDEIEAGGKADDSGFAEEAHEVLGRGEAGHSGTEGVDGVKEADGLTDVGGTADEVLDEQWERAAHEERGDEEQEEGEDTGDEDGVAGGERGHSMEDPERAGAKGTDGDLNCAEGEEQADAWLGGKSAASERTQAEAEHENGDDDGDGFDVDAVGGEQGALPDDLVEERGKSGEEEEQVVETQLRRSGKLLQGLGWGFAEEDCGIGHGCSACGSRRCS